ncbi:MAG: hypothetical protein KC492_25800 [Myxococcales bacterium]|nr:hypothetical protein [Myxococcales bacterium]
MSRGTGSGDVGSTHCSRSPVLAPTDAEGASNLTECSARFSVRTLHGELASTVMAHTGNTRLPVGREDQREDLADHVVSLVCRKPGTEYRVDHRPALSDGYKLVSGQG